jgi:hypothetical protein
MAHVAPMGTPSRGDVAMKPRISLRAALNDPNLLGKSLPGLSWWPWRTLLIAAMGEALTAEERPVFKNLTGRDREAGVPCEELIGVIGRRGGKTEAISTLATYVSACCDHPSLVPGETGVCLLIAADVDQAGIALDRIEAKFRVSPILRQLVKARTAKQLRLSNGVVIQVRASDFRRVRGPTLICAIGDEACFWSTNEGSANPDSQICGALRPALATTKGPLILISSPYAKKGEVYNQLKSDEFCSAFLRFCGGGECRQSIAR